MELRAMAKKQEKGKPAIGKRLKKELKRVVRKHGPTIAIGLLTGVVLDIADKGDR